MRPSHAAQLCLNPDSPSALQSGESTYLFVARASDVAQNQRLYSASGGDEAEVVGKSVAKYTGLASRSSMTDT